MERGDYVNRQRLHYMHRDSAAYRNFNLQKVSLSNSNRHKPDNYSQSTSNASYSGLNSNGLDSLVSFLFILSAFSRIKSRKQ